MMSAELYRALPAMDAVLNTLGEAAPVLCAATPRPLLRDAAEAFLNSRRAGIAAGTITSPVELALPALLPALLRHVEAFCRPHLRRVLNATGVVIHTNLGRSLLPPEAVAAVAEAAGSYSNLEFDLATGARGSRYSHVEALVCRLTGAEATLAVNNNAAAVLLVLDALCKGREVVVSRGQLVEIGGSFRIPEVMERGGCTLREVGTTNRTHPEDYRAAITERTAAILKVHTSNYRIEGFFAEVPTADLADLAHAHSLPLIEDLGSGSLCNFAAHGLPALADEPTVQAVIAAGVDVVTFSGDKVLGGPQAGIIAGKKEYIDRIKKCQLLRALRIDKLTLAALEAVLRLYLEPEEAVRRVPTLAMICAAPEELRMRAEALAQALAEVPGLGATVVPGVSRVGGGAFPERDLPTSLVRLETGLSSEILRARLLAADIPLVGRVEDNAFHLDPRTLRDQEFALAAETLRGAMADSPAL